MLKIIPYIAAVVLMTLLSTTTYAEESHQDIDDSGVLYVHGSLTESACRLEMDSARQSVEAGNIDSAEFSSVGDNAPPFLVKIRLEGCQFSVNHHRDHTTGNRAWSNDGPSVSVRFSAPRDISNPSLFNVTGTRGFGLKFIDDEGHTIQPYSASRIEFLNPENNSLIYTVVPVRTSSPLTGGRWQSIINFGLEYD